MHSNLSYISLFSLLQRVCQSKVPLLTLPLQFLPSLKGVFRHFLSTRTQGKHAEVGPLRASGSLQAVATSWNLIQTTSVYFYTIPRSFLSSPSFKRPLYPLAHPVSGPGFCATLGLWRNRNCGKAWLRVCHFYHKQGVIS